MLKAQEQESANPVCCSVCYLEHERRAFRRSPPPVSSPSNGEGKRVCHEPRLLLESSQTMHPPHHHLASCLSRRKVKNCFPCCSVGSAATVSDRTQQVPQSVLALPDGAMGYALKLLTWLGVLQLSLSAVDHFASQRCFSTRTVSAFHVLTRALSVRYQQWRPV